MDEYDPVCTCRNRNSNANPCFIQQTHCRRLGGPIRPGSRYPKDGSGNQEDTGAWYGVVPKLPFEYV